jgi:putative ABC transport system permease protein
VFAAVGAAMSKTIFLSGDGPIEQVRAQDVTVGFLDVLGVAPRWGRTFNPGDESDPSVWAVIISEDLARRRFGQPHRAPGQRLEATAGPLVVVGVMDGSFVYPNARNHIWRALDPVGPLTRNFGGLSMYARVAPGAPMDRFGELFLARVPVVGAAAGVATYRADTSPLFAPAPASRSSITLVLFCAALCLLLAACANVASLELAGAVRRARTFAVQRALGASRWDLAGQCAVEGAILVAASFGGALMLAALIAQGLAPTLPEIARLRSNNPVDLDGRAILAMTGLAALAWAVAALPPVLAASRSTLITLLKTEDRSSAMSRGAVWLRRTLTASQVALAVMLVVGGLLYGRSYRNLLAVDKGFDSRDLFMVDWTMPPDFAVGGLSARAVDQLRQTPGIDAVTTSAPPPSRGDSPSAVDFEIDGQPPVSPPILLGRKWVDYDYFSVVRMPLRHGRLPAVGDPETDVVVPEQFARRLFPNGQAVGRTFRRTPRDPWMTIVAVVGDFRTERTRMPEPGDSGLYYYSFPPAPKPPPSPAPPAKAEKRIDTGGVTRFLTLTVRTNGRMSDADLLARARLIEPGLPVTVSSVDERYASQSADTRLASQIVGTFSVLAFVISMAGVFGVMAFLVAGRTREIGIRMALGADPAVVRRMVMSSSARMVMLGAATGTTLALVASRWVRSELFGVSPTDPLTYALAAFGVVGVALIATWQPARQASRVDPAVTLRSE